jgi:mannitol/fructose-specific phosphotransferase system IIA component (Ntr-type)
MGIIVVPDGIACGALDRKTSRVFVFTIAPQNNSNEYLKIMAELVLCLDLMKKLINC